MKTMQKNDKYYDTFSVLETTKLMKSKQWKSNETNVMKLVL